MRFTGKWLTLINGKHYCAVNVHFDRGSKVIAICMQIELSNWLLRISESLPQKSTSTQ